MATKSKATKFTGQPRRKTVVVATKSDVRTAAPREFRAKRDSNPGVEFKQILAEAITAKLQQDNLSIAALARQMGTGRTAVRRILDRTNTSITLGTMSKVTQAVGLRLILQTEPLSPDQLGRLASKLIADPTKEEAARITEQIVAGFYPRNPARDPVLAMASSSP